MVSDSQAHWPDMNLSWRDSDSQQGNELGLGFRWVLTNQGQGSWFPKILSVFVRRAVPFVPFPTMLPSNITQDISPCLLILFCM